MKSSCRIPVVIPAYKPGPPLVTLVEELLRRGIRSVIVVDDGSGPEFADCFARISGRSGVKVLHHAVNLGKGAALKTGMNAALVAFPDCCGVVTADADGQHHPDDICGVAEELQRSSNALILGVRSFDKKAPWKSRLGNHLTAVLTRFLVGQNLIDTQTGLRGVPAGLIPHLLHMSASGYEFELDMLIASKHQSWPVLQIPIRTIYLENNKSSHFRPIVDSMRIYFLLLRFSALSLATAAIDNIVFLSTYPFTSSIAVSQICGRVVATAFNYLGARRAVFHSGQRHAVVLPKYVALVVCNALISYALIRLLHDRAGIAVLPAKLGAEGLLFIVSFIIQRDFVFTGRRTLPSSEPASPRVQAAP